MDNSGEISAMSAEELKDALRLAELELEDVRYERRFTLGQTGIHLGGRERMQLEDAWSKDETHLRERIAAIRGRLEDPQAAS